MSTLEIIRDGDEIYCRAPSVTDLLKDLQQLRGASNSNTRSRNGAQGRVPGETTVKSPSGRPERPSAKLR